MSLSSLKPLVNNHVLWESFKELVEGEITSSTKLLEQQTDPVLIYRSQGQIEAFRKLLRLRDRVNG